MAMYRVVPDTVTIKPSKSSFTTEEDIYLNVKATLQRKDGMGAWLSWESDYYLWDDDTNQLIKEEHRAHSCAPWSSPDTAEDDFTWKIGKRPEKTYHWTVVISAHG